MSNTFEILNPNRHVKFGAGSSQPGLTVTVRELSWCDLNALLERITKQIATISEGANEAKINFTIEGVTGLIHESRETVETILTQTTTLNAEQIGKLSITEAFGLLDQALDLNVASLQTGTKKAFGRITKFVGGAAVGNQPTPTSPAPSIS